MTREELRWALGLVADRSVSLCTALTEVRELAERDQLTRIIEVITRELSGYSRVADLPNFRRARATYGYRTRSGQWLNCIPQPIRRQGWIMDRTPERPHWLPEQEYHDLAPVMSPLAALEQFTADRKPVEFVADDPLLNQMGLRVALPPTELPKVSFWTLDFFARYKPKDPRATELLFRVELHALAEVLDGLSASIAGLFRHEAARQGIFDEPEPSGPTLYTEVNVSQHQGDHNVANNSQVGAMGRNARVENNKFQQVSVPQSVGVDLTMLEQELATLRLRMRQAAVEPEHDEAVAAIGRAEKAAKLGDETSVLQALKSAGQWALDIATKIGVEVASTALRTALGLPT